MTKQRSGNRDQRSENVSESGVPEKSPSSKRYLGPAIICIAALVAISPEMTRGTSCGHDFDFHLASWFDAQAAWRHRLFYPHWAPSPNYFAGEPRFVFYPPLTWMLGAACGLILKWKFVEATITFLFLALAGLATRLLARHTKLGDGPATLAGCGALFSGYSMFTAYERSAFGELAGGFWIPLLLLLVLRDRNAQQRTWHRAFDGSALLLALVIAGAWLSNAPLGVMASYLLAAVAFAAALLRRTWGPILRSILAVVIGIGLTCAYLVPAAMQQKWVQIRQATDDPGLAVENSFLFGHQADPNLELHDVELWRVSVIVVMMIGVALLCFFIAWRRERLSDRSWWIPLALIPLVVLLLQLPFSLPLWNAVPKLRFLQFPWRWMVTVEAPLGIFFAAALWPTRRWLRNVVVACSSLMFLTITAVAGFIFHQPCDDEDAVWAMIDSYRTGQGFEGTAEYAPPGADNSLVAVGLPDACLTTNPDTVLATASDGNIPQWDPANGHCDAIYSWQAASQPEHLRLSAGIPHAGFLILHLRNYAAWQVRVNGRLLAFGADPILPRLPHRDDGLIAVPVAHGPVQISIDWATTGDEVLGRWLTGLSLLALLGLYAVERRSSKHTSAMLTSPRPATAPRVS